MSAPIPTRWQELYAACKDGKYTSSVQQIEAIEQIAALSQANEQLFTAGEKTYQNFVRAAKRIAALEEALDQIDLVDLVQSGQISQMAYDKLRAGLAATEEKEKA